MRCTSRRALVRASLSVAGLGVLTSCGLRLGPSLTPRAPTVGILLFGTPTTDPTLPAFVQGLAELGYRDGQNLTLEYRYAEGRPERLPELATELVRLTPDLIFALGGDVAPAA